MRFQEAVLDELVKGVGRVFPLATEVALAERMSNGVISIVVYVLVGRRFVCVEYISASLIVLSIGSASRSP